MVTTLQGTVFFLWSKGTIYEGDVINGKPDNGDIKLANGNHGGIYKDGKYIPDHSNEPSVVKQTVDAIAPRDIVTGQRSLNLESEPAEIQRATQQMQQIIGASKSKGVGFDADSEMMDRLRTMMHKIAGVSHRPSIPWEIHLIESPTVNAFAIGGGKVFFYRGVFGDKGLINPNDDNEIAAVLAHEMAHNTLRHIGKRRRS